MAQHKSAEKRNRQTIRRTEVNRVRVGQIRTKIKEVESAILSGDKAKAQAALVSAQPVIMSGVNKGVLKLTTASRKMSRLSARVKAISTEASAAKAAGTKKPAAKAAKKTGAKA